MSSGSSGGIRCHNYEEIWRNIEQPETVPSQEVAFNDSEQKMSLMGKRQFQVKCKHSENQRD